MRDMRIFGIILARVLLASAAAAFSGGIALGQPQQPASALKGHDTNAPVDIVSDRLEVQDRADRAVFVGNVHATQTDLSLDTQRLTVAYSGGADHLQINRLDAAGGVVVKSPSETARGDFGVYDLDRKLITIIGNVRLARQSDLISGSRLVIDLDSGRAVIDGGPPGVNQSGGRVSGHFTVPQKQPRPR